MITQEKIDRINFLARKSKSTGLNSEETAEQQKLRREYIDAYKQSLRGILDNTKIVRPDGTEEPLKKQTNK